MKFFETSELEILFFEELQLPLKTYTKTPWIERLLGFIFSPPLVILMLVIILVFKEHKKNKTNFHRPVYQKGEN